ncbi:uncharacterized protein LOC141899965 isoform X2 [Tubulanus polymorphus]
MFPFLPALVLYLGYAEEEKGYYAGIIASSFFIGRVVASYFWGWLSDKKGRRVVILSNLGCLCILTLMFGFTTNLWFAIIDRFLTGVMNGVIGTGKVVLYEVSDNSNQAVHMIVISVAWGCGSFLGPAISGFLATPVEKYPDSFDKNGIFGMFPFLLPCIVGCAMLIFTTIIVYIYLPETNEMLKEKPDKLIIVHSKNDVCAKCKMGFTDDVYISGVAMSVENLFDGRHHSDLHNPVFRALSHQHLGQSNNLKKPATSQQGEKKIEFRGSSRRRSISVPDLRLVPQKSGFKEVSNGEVQDTVNINSDFKSNNFVNNGEEIVDCKVCFRCHQRILLDSIDVNDNEKSDEKVTYSLYQRFVRSDFVTLLKSRDVQKCMVLYTLYSFAVIGYHEVFAVWASTDSYYDGLEFSTEKIGLAIGFVALPTIVLQIMIFPKLEVRYGAKRAFMGNCFIMMLVAGLLPITHLVYDKPIQLWSCLTILLIPDRVCAVCCFCSIALFVNNSVKPAFAGSVNGIGITFAALARAFAPTVGGSLFAWSITKGRQFGYPFDVNCVFIMFSLVYMVSLIVVLSIPNRLNFQNKGIPEDQPQTEETEHLINCNNTQPSGCNGVNKENIV